MSLVLDWPPPTLSRLGAEGLDETRPDRRRHLLENVVRVGRGAPIELDVLERQLDLHLLLVEVA